MHARFANLISATLLVGMLGACGARQTPYDGITDPPVVEARLHAVTLVADSDAAVEKILAAGYTAVELPANYQRADEVQAAIWDVPESVAKAIRTFTAPPGKPGLRLLVMPLAARERTADAHVVKAFFRNVLGTTVPEWPLAAPADDSLRVQVLTYRIADVVVANRRLRENNIPIVHTPVGLTTAYLGDHKTLAIRAPDGTVVQLVETKAD